MESYFGNTQHKDTSSRIFMKPSSQTPNIVKAQYILSSEENITAEKWKDLCSKIYKSVLRSTFEGCSQLESATQVVVDWDKNNKADSESFAKLISLMGRIGLMERAFAFDWQKELAYIISGMSQTVRIHLFNNLGIEHFWIIVENPSTDIVLEYSQSYIEVIGKYPEANCDFIVFGRNETDCLSLPEDTYTIAIKE